MEISGETLIAKDGQPFFQGELKPITAGNPVACPIMEIFMSNNGFHPAQISICGGVCIRQHKFTVKDIQTLIFHRAHIEMADSNDLKQV